jgi:hypothetical protein
MIRNIARCPYCHATVDIDCQSGATLFDPDKCDGKPCSHLACYWVALSFDDCSDGHREAPVSRLWEIGRGEWNVRGLTSDRDAALTNYFCDYGFDTIPPQLIPSTPHTLVGGSAMQREECETGTGEFSVIRLGRRLAATLDGWAIFAPMPKRVMRDVAILSDCYET